MKSKLYNFGIILLLAISFSACIFDKDIKTSIVSGKVTDSGGKPIENVNIAYQTIDGTQTMLTKSDGTYSISFTQSGIFIINFSKEGYLSKSVESMIKKGEKIQKDIQLQSYSEAAFIELETSEHIFQNFGGTFHLEVKTNNEIDVKYGNESWLHISKNNNYLTFKCDTNEIADARTAEIIISGPYNLSKTFKIIQLAGPVLRIVDYWKKDGATTQYDTNPYVSFSREVSVESAILNSNSVSYTISPDKKSVIFDNLKLDLFSTSELTLKVVDSDGNKITFNENVSLFLGKHLYTVPFINDIVFTKDEKYFWVLNSEYRNSFLEQFSTSDFKKLRSIPIDQYV